MDNQQGKTAYLAYRSFSNGVSLINGDNLPPWEALPRSIQNAWQAAAIEVLRNY